MKFWKRPLWRVPVVLGGAGIFCRALIYFLGIVWGRVQMARGPGPDGAYVLTTGHMSEIHAALSFLLFWLAGWRYIRGLTRREIFLSSSVMVLLNAALLAWEQISQALGGYSLWCYRFYALAEGELWLNHLLFHLFDAVTVPLCIPGLFLPYLYLVFGKKSASS